MLKFFFVYLLESFEADTMSCMYKCSINTFLFIKESSIIPLYISCYTKVVMDPCCHCVSGMARMCCDSRKAVRQAAITYLQRALLAHELQDLMALEWFACFKEVCTYACVHTCSLATH